jgi:CubicO group peptidase (beta-lactamase class C family)
MMAELVSADAIVALVQGMQGDWKVPGVALGVIQDGQVLLRAGFGQRDTSHPLPVTPQTVFAIGSASKAFTTMALGMLADENRLDWDHPVREYLPTFRLYDAFASERMTPRDLVTHRSGLPRHDLMWYNSPFSREELFLRLRYLEPNKDLRTLFQYSNLMFMTAGYLVGELSGGTWETFVERRILEPLGMRATNFSVEVTQQGEDFALPYQEKEGQVRPIPFRTIDNVGPAGSINSTVDDMLAWLGLHIDQGKHGNLQIASAHTLAQIHTPQMVVQDAVFQTFFQAELLSYGLGWFIQDYRGHVLIHHGGNIDGFSAHVSMLPHERAGIVVLTNLNDTLLPIALGFSIYDRLLGLEPVDWSQRLKRVQDEVREAVKQGNATASPKNGPAGVPPHPLVDYAGEYEHPGYGTVSVKAEGEGLTATYNDISYSLRHLNYDAFQFRYEAFDVLMNASFSADTRGGINRLAIAMEPNVPEVVFQRLPDPQMRDSAFLERFAGAYELLGMPITIFLKGSHTLAVALPGQPEQELVPYRGTEFDVQGQSGFSLRFEVDESGRVTGAVFDQAGVLFNVPRR